MENYFSKNLSKNILIGENAGADLTFETHRLILKSESIDLDEKMTDREYKLVVSTLIAFLENDNKHKG